jgi:hypothetical protein
MAEQTTKPTGTFAKLMASSPPQGERTPVQQAARTPEPQTAGMPANQIASKPASQKASKLVGQPPTIEGPAKQHTQRSLSASTLAGKQDSLLASKHASTLALTPESLETIRKVVKNPGKEEVLYVRVSKEEKDALDDVSYTYKRQDIKTSDNEIARLAVNVLLEDYKTNGATSLLAMLLDSLHA